MEEFEGGGLDTPTAKLFEEIKKTFDSELIKKKDPDLLKEKIKNSLERVQVPELSIDQKRDLFKALMEFYKSTDTNISSSKPSSKPVTKQGKNERWVPPGTASSSTQSKSLLTEEEIFKVLYENSSFITPKDKYTIFEKNARYKKFASEIDKKPEAAAERKRLRIEEERKAKEEADKAEAEKQKEAQQKEAEEKARQLAEEKAIQLAKEAADKAEEQRLKAAAEKLRKQKEAEAKTRQEAEKAERLRLEAEKAERLRLEAEAKEKTRQEEERKAKEAAENTRPIIGHFELNKGTAVFIEDNPQPSPELPLNPTKPEIYSFHKKYYYTKSNPNEFYEYK